MKKGKLTIFFGYTNTMDTIEAMMEKAKLEQSFNRDVLIFVSPQQPFYDLDQILERHPDVVVVDNIGYVNEEKQRHHQRYQDIDELLNAGIDVYTTLKVDQIESLQDHILSILGHEAKETIPDSVFDEADYAIFVDKEDNENKEIAALRELALRRLADRISYRSLYSQGQQGEHVLACLSSAPSNARIIRTASRMANAFNSKFTAIFVQTPEYQYISQENRERLSMHQKLAQQLGATIETVFGEDIPFQIAEFARLSGVTKIVLGQSATRQKTLFYKPSFAQQLIHHAPDIDVYIIPEENIVNYKPKHHHSNFIVNVFKSGAILFLATLCSILFEHLGFTSANIIMVYILGVLLTSIATTDRMYSLVSSIASVFIFNFLFTEPRFSLAAYASGYPVTFIVMFLTAFITGTFANRYKEQASESAKNAYRNKILLDTNQLISKARTKAEILDATAHQIVKLLGRNIVVYGVEENELMQPVLYSNDSSQIVSVDQKEMMASQWVYKNNQSAGATTDTMSDVSFLYLAIRVNEKVYGVVGIEAKYSPLDRSENSILLSVLGECALALENEKNLREKEEAAVFAQSEQLRANLLRSISHDLRTPLTSISGNASNLLTNANSFDEKTRNHLYKDIYDDSVWLINLVENLLFATRFEEGKMQLTTQPELLNDMIDEVLSRFMHKNKSHTFIWNPTEELIFVKVDAKLIMQVLVNIIDNAIKYTPERSQITISITKDHHQAYVSIADNGEGISDEEKSKIFEKFYCGENKIADNRRSLGLGLYLCKSIVEVHGGTIVVQDHYPKGTVFTFSLPIEEVTIHE